MCHKLFSPTHSGFRPSVALYLPRIVALVMLAVAVPSASIQEAIVRKTENFQFIRCNDNFAGNSYGTFFVRIASCVNMVAANGILYGSANLEINNSKLYDYGNASHGKRTGISPLCWAGCALAMKRLPCRFSFRLEQKPWTYHTFAELHGSAIVL